MRRSLAAAVFCALVVAGSALGADKGFSPPEPASPNAERINDSYLWIAIFTGAILVLVQGSLIWFAVRYRADRRRRDEDGAQVHGNTNLELAWTVAPVLVLVAIGAFVFYKLPVIQDVPAASAQGGRVDVTVKGYRYYWNYEYDNGVIAVDRLRAPVDQTMKLNITAPPFEVIHSWWIPALGGKFDAIPGQVNETWFRAATAGVYRGQCAEFCGIEHASMDAEVEAMPRDEFEEWLDDEAAAQEAGTSNLGRDTFAGACATCHGIDGEGDIGPRLAGNPLIGDARAVEQVVRGGRNEMPPVGGDWDDRQMRALTDYLEEELRGG
ncbi:MAG: cytochrome c oxidase subunit II [Gaiellaceae bacterium]